MSEKFIGSKLLQAREEKGLSIADVSEITNIRKSYLLALEDENFDELPEAVYTKNFVKLYARALGIDNQELIEHYENKFQTTPIEQATDVPEYRDFSNPKKASRISPLLITLLLLGLLAAAAAGLWFFKRDLVYKTFPQLDPNPVVLDDSTNTIDSDPSTNLSTNSSNTSTLDNTLNTSSDTNANNTNTSTDSIPNLLTDSTDANLDTNSNNQGNAPGAANSDTEVNTTENISDNLTEATSTETSLNAETSDNAQATEIPAEIPETIKISIRTEPSGATVSIDNFVLAQTTPVIKAPISSGEKRNLVVSLDGYISYNEDLDLYEDTNLELVLEPVQASEEASENVTTTTNTETTGTAIKITTTEDTWLEVYQGSARGNGKELVYKVIKAGQEFNFNLPIYIHTGNAGGVRITLNGKDLGKMGSSGEVLGRAYSKN